MKKEEKEKILDMLQDISYAHEEGEDEFWQKWSEVHKFISEQKTEETDDGILVTDICWDTDEEDADLPGRVTVPRGTDIDRIADYLSDTYGFCVYSFHVNESRKIRVQTPPERSKRECCRMTNILELLFCTKEKVPESLERSWSTLRPAKTRDMFSSGYIPKIFLFGTAYSNMYCNPTYNYVE